MSSNTRSLAQTTSTMGISVARWPPIFVLCHSPYPSRSSGTLPVLSKNLSLFEHSPQIQGPPSPPTSTSYSHPCYPDQRARAHRYCPRNPRAITKVSTRRVHRYNGLPCASSIDHPLRHRASQPYRRGRHQGAPILRVWPGGFCAILTVNQQKEWNRHTD